MRVTAVQQVGVAMFSTGNFKNIVGVAEYDEQQQQQQLDSIKSTGVENPALGETEPRPQQQQQQQQAKDGQQQHQYLELDPMDPCYRATVPVKLGLGPRGDYSWVAMDETAKRDSDIKHLVNHAFQNTFCSLEVNVG